MLIAHATLVHRSTSMYQLPCPFRISYFCFTVLHCTVLIMISATVVGLCSLESDVLFLQFLTENNAKLFSISGIYDINNKERISGVPWTLLHTNTERSWRQDVSLADFFLCLTRDLFCTNTYSNL